MNIPFVKTLNSKITVANSIVFFISIIFISIAISIMTYKDGIQTQIEIVTHQAKNARLQINALYQQAIIDIRTLATTGQIQHFQDQHLKKALTKEDKDKVISLFINFIKNNPHYQEVRLLESAGPGMELVRVNNYKGIQVITKKDLQPKASRDYFQKSLHMSENEIYISEINLRRESYFDGPQIDTPQIRFVLPLFTNKIHSLFLILNLDFKYLTNKLDQMFNNINELIIYNSDGHYIHDTRSFKNTTFTFEFEKNPQLYIDFPELKQDLSQDIIRQGSNIYYNFQLSFPNTPKSNSIGLIISLKKDLAMRHSTYIIKAAIIILCIGLVIIILTSKFLSKKILSPLNKLSEQIHNPSLVNEIKKLSEERHDEVHQIAGKLSDYLYKIKQNESFLNSIFEKSQDGFCLIDSYGKILMTNSSLEQMFGYTKNELLDTPIENLMYSLHANQHQAYIDNYLKGGSQLALRKGRELVAKKKDGSRLPIFLTVAEIKVNSNTRSNFFGIVRDLTQLKDIEDHLEAEKKISLIESRFATLGKMLSGIAHEINSPLQNIMLTNELISEYTTQKNYEGIKRETHALSSEIQRISNIIESMKSLTRGKNQDNIKYEELNKMMDEVKDIIQYKLKLASINFVIDTGMTRNISINCNKTEIQQIILNLLNNAIDSLAKSSTIEPTIELITRKEEHFVYIYIKDNGPGIRHKDAQRIFEPLYTTKDVGKGTGLGLSISKRLAKNNSATLEYIPSKKTIFRLQLSQWRMNNES